MGIDEQELTMDIEVRLNRIEQLLESLLERQTIREWYSVEQFAEIVGLSCFSVREHCRLRRLNAEKKTSGRGAHANWVISHAELLRFQRFGLLPVKVQ